ncbi:hypothetical protein X975_01430, partial [Stegodyphus mimosarum]
MTMRSAPFTYWMFFLAYIMTFTSARYKQPHTPLHQRMDPSLLKETFHVESYDQVPPYEVVHLRSVSKRSADAGSNGEIKHVHLQAFGRDMQLNLHRNDEFDDRLKSMKMYLAESTNNGIQYKEMPAEDDDPGTTYHDLEQMAAVTIRQGADGKMQMEGTIGNDLVVKPVPTAILIPEDGFVDDEMFLDENESYERTRNSSQQRNVANASRSWRPTSATRAGAHVIYKGQMISNDSHSDFR